MCFYIVKHQDISKLYFQYYSYGFRCRPCSAVLLFEMKKIFANLAVAMHHCLGSAFLELFTAINYIYFTSREI